MLAELLRVPHSLVEVFFFDALELFFGYRTASLFTTFFILPFFFSLLHPLDSIFLLNQRFHTCFCLFFSFFSLLLFSSQTNGLSALRDARTRGQGPARSRPNPTERREEKCEPATTTTWCGDGEVDAGDSTHSFYSTVDCPIRKGSSLSSITIDDRTLWLANY